MASQTNHHLVDIHADDPTEQGSLLANGLIKFRRGSGERRQPPPPPLPQRNFHRQVSLETGFSVLSMEGKDAKGNVTGTSGGSKDRKVLSRSGKSLGVVRDGDGDGQRKGDFSMFRTKSALIKQNSLMPVRKESGLDLNNVEGGGGGGGGGGEGGVEGGSMRAFQQHFFK